jgi:hypothetical protein
MFFAAIDFGAVAVGAASGVATYLLSNTLLEWVKTVLRVRRLRRALVCDCAGIVDNMKKVQEQISEFNRSKLSPPASEFQRVSDLHNGFVVSGPIEEVKELIQLVDPAEASLITYMFDRWERFSGVEARYHAAYQRLLEAVAKSESGGTGL